MTIELSPARRAMLDALKISERDNAPGTLTLDEIRVEAQKMADLGKVEIAIGWTINDETGLREAGYCPVSSLEILVLEPVDVVRPYKGGRADYADRQENRRERLENAAERAREASNHHYRQSRAAVEHIPPGQPILVGHYSERHHRAALARADRHMGASVAAAKSAEVLARRADGVGGGGISSDDPEALVKLRAELVALQTSQEKMKAANKLIRRNAGNTEAQTLSLKAEGFSDEEIQNLLFPRFSRGQGFPSYRLSNNNANIRRVAARIEDLQRQAAKPEGDRMESKSGVVYRVADNRVQLVFAGKPAEKIRDELKRWGFRWAPSNGAWQRHLNTAGENAAKHIISWLDQEGI